MPKDRVSDVEESVMLVATLVFLSMPFAERQRAVGELPALLDRICWKVSDPVLHSVLGAADAANEMEEEQLKSAGLTSTASGEGGE